MSQSHCASLTEALTNVVVGFALALGVQSGLFPLIGITITLRQNIGISLVFTGLSLIRSYVLRRLFERLGQGRVSPCVPRRNRGTPS